VSTAELVVRIGVDMGGLDRGLATATAEIESFTRTVDKSGGSLKSAGSDADRAANDVEHLGSNVKGARAEWDRWSSHIPIVGGLLDKVNRSVLQGVTGLLRLAPGLEGVASEFEQLAPAMVPVLSYAEVLPAAFFAVAFAANFLADGLGVVLAVIGDLVAPITVVAGLLGGLAAGFVIGAQRAAKGGGALQQFANKLATLKSMFGHTADVLAHVFLPYLMQLADDAQKALLWVDKLAHMPLGKAMRTAAQQGAQGFKKMLDQIGGWLAKPIRLAIEIAFGTGKGGNEASSAVSQIWNEFVRYWTGYTAQKEVFIGGHWVMEQKTVDGALQPFLDWFNRHDFTAQGEKIAHTIMQGVNKISGPLSTLLGHIFLDAAGKASVDLLKALFSYHPALPYVKKWTEQLWQWLNKKASAAGQWLRQEESKAWTAIKQKASGVLGDIAAWVRSKVGQAWSYAKGKAGDAWHYVRNLAGGILSSIVGWVRGKVAGAWQAVHNAAERVWTYIKGLFSKVLSVHISWPSPPGWVSKLLGTSGIDILSSIPGVHGATGGIVTRPTLAVIGEAGTEAVVPLNRTPGSSPLPTTGGGGGNVYAPTFIITGNNVLSNDQQTAREFARILSPHMGKVVTVGAR
jgi:hypothetical protein